MSPYTDVTCMLIRLVHNVPTCVPSVPNVNVPNHA